MAPDSRANKIIRVTMKHHTLLHAVSLLILAATSVSLAQSDERKTSVPTAVREKACSFNIHGVWKSDATSETNPIFYSFDPNGWITVLGHTEGALPQDFEMTAQAQYRLDDPAAPTRIEFNAKGKNDAFASGISSFEIVQYSDDSFTIGNLSTGDRIRWDRVAARRYFLTFAAAAGQEAQPAQVYAAWTSLDGRKVETKVIGVHMKKSGSGSVEPIFDVVPTEIFDEFASNPASEAQDEDSKSVQTKLPAAKEANSRVVMRVELPESDFLRSQKVHDLWANFVKEKVLPNKDAYVNAMEFLTKAAESVNQCGEKIKLDKVDLSKPDDDFATSKAQQRPFAYIKQMRKRNRELHVPIAMFPWSWRPNIALSN